MILFIIFLTLTITLNFIQYHNKLYLMNNLYIENKKNEEIKKTLRQQSIIKSWKKRYQYLQPHMISQYNNRVDSFIHRMKVKPVQIQVQQQINSREMNQFRNSYEKQKNVTDQIFKFRDSVDWQSVLTPLQRVERYSAQKQKLEYLNKNEIPKCLINRDLASQEPYQPIKQTKFRDRQKQKQLHLDAMRFNYLPTESKISRKNLIKVNQRYSHSRTNSFSQCTKHKEQFNKSANLENQIITRNKFYKNLSIKQKHEKQKIMTTSNFNQFRRSTGDSSFQKKHDWSQVQISIGNKKQQKLHFKAAIEIASNKNNLPIKTILENCSIFRFKQKQKGQQTNGQKSK